MPNVTTTYQQEFIARRHGEFLMLIKEAKYSRMWIWQEGTKIWYTPEEFEEMVFVRKNLHFYETTVFKIADPIIALKMADESIDTMRKRRDEFNLKILKYYQDLK